MDRQLTSFAARPALSALSLLLPLPDSLPLLLLPDSKSW
jgi:hypothetical protein